MNTVHLSIYLCLLQFLSSVSCSFQSTTAQYLTQVLALSAWVFLSEAHSSPLVKETRGPSFSDRAFSKAAAGVMLFKPVAPAPSCAQLKAIEDTLMSETRRNHPAAAKSLQLWPTLCHPTDGSPPGSSEPGILQARTLGWVAVSSSRNYHNYPLTCEISHCS